MADLRISDLTEATSVDSTDLIVISQDDGDSTFTSKKVTGSNFDMIKGLRYYGVSTTDPTSPTPAEGDEYYNSVLDKKMYYDVTRGWLSIETMTFYFGRNGTVTAGTYYRTINGLAYSSTNGVYLPWNATITGIGYTRDDIDSATFEVTADGVTTSATLISTANKGGITTLNVDVTSASILGVRNQSGGNTTDRAHGWISLKWRA